MSEPSTIKINEVEYIRKDSARRASNRGGEKENK